MSETLPQAQGYQQLFRTLASDVRRNSGIDSGNFHVFRSRCPTDQVVTLEYKAKRLPAQPGQGIPIQSGYVLPRKAILTTGWPVQAANDVHQDGLSRPGSAHDG